MATQDVPPPPRKEDQKFDHWLYQFWKRVGVTAAGFVASSPVTIGTGAGTYTFGHGTSGVVSGTYGGSTSIPQIVVNTYGHITAVSTFATSAAGKWTPWTYIVAATDTLDIDDGKQMLFGQQLIVDGTGVVNVDGTGQLHIL